MATTIMGDFKVLEASERGSQIIFQSGPTDFHQFIQSTHLLEIPATNGFFTWFCKNSKSKLDRCFTHSEWIRQFSNLSLIILSRSLLINWILASSSSVNWVPKLFRFLNYWVSHPNCLSIIENSWKQNAHHPAPEKLKLLKETPKSWNKTEFRIID